MTSVAFAAVQMRSSLYEPERNRTLSVERLASAAERGAELVVLPELAISGYGLNRDGLSRSSEAADGPTLEAWTRFAKTTGCFVVGGFCESDGDRLYNSAMLVGPEGRLGLYRKLHLFDAEKQVFVPGDLGLPCFDLPFGRIGVCVCYDLRFIEVTRALALQGADVIVVPTAWVGGFDANPIDSGGYITQARGALVQANLNQVFVVCASQCGQAGDTRFLGSSMIASPFGQALLPPLDADEEDIVVAKVDLADAETARVRSPLIRPRQDRRTDVYGLALGSKVM